MELVLPQRQEGYIEDMIEHHVLAGINLVGILLDLMGGLYLAYDLLGGRKGPLRTMTRCATYSVLFGLGDGLPLGLTFGLVAGTGTGLPLGLEFRSAGLNGASVRPFPYRTFAFGFFRGLALALAAWLTFGLRFGAAFGLMSGLGLLLVCMLRFAPSDEYQALAKPTLHRANCWGHSSAVAQSGSQGFSRGY